jgi:uncharacterized protein (DUF885 family)
MTTRLFLSRWQNRTLGLLLWTFVAGPVVLCQTPNAELQALADEFLRWRATTQFCSPDDIPRVERPKGWVPAVSANDLEGVREKYADFRQRLDALEREHWSRSDSVDFLLLRSAIERIHWDVDVLRAPYRDPDFYIQQTLGAVYELLLPASPITKERAQEIVLRLTSIPATLRAGKENLSEAVRPFASAALEALEGVRGKLGKMVDGLKPVVPKDLQSPLVDAAQTAADSLEEFAAWLKNGLEEMNDDFSVGERNYTYYLRMIALNPLTPEEMLVLGRSEFARAVTCEELEHVRNARLPEPEFFKSIEQQMEQEKKDELAVRQFLVDRKLLTIPAWMKHYTNRPRPGYVAPLVGLGVVDDLSSPSRLTDNGVSYIPAPSGSLSYFYRASARDPRPILLHEGIPGHYFQLVMSWNNRNPLRRHYFDSGSNEGWGFYVEEMMLQAGLFENDRPRTRETIYNFMRLRALRVEADIKLALGEFSINAAANYLASMVPMDSVTAAREAIFFASTPGQGITYQVGKNQIQKFISDAKLLQGKAFDLRKIHDYIVTNGNVPVALLRWEYLGLRDEIERFW